MGSREVEALYVDSLGPYPKLLGAERCWGFERDARLYTGAGPIIAHPPCGPWGRLSGSNLSGTDLSDTDLSNTDLSNLSGSNLSRSNLRPSPQEALAERDRARQNHPRVPIVEKLDAAIIAEIEGESKLDMSQWHTCEKRHCRAGWAIHKAGAAGKELESRLGPFVAGRLIYLVSTGRRPDFFATDADALADIKLCAAEQNATAG